MTVEQLRAILHVVPESRRAFARSLVDYHDRHGRWSPRQQFFADDIVEQNRRREAATFAVDISGNPDHPPPFTGGNIMPPPILAAHADEILRGPSGGCIVPRDEFMQRHAVPTDGEIMGRMFRGVVYPTHEEALTARRADEAAETARLAAVQADMTPPPQGVGTVLQWFTASRRENPRSRARITFPRASVGAGLRLASPPTGSRWTPETTFFVFRERVYMGRVTDGLFHPGMRRDATVFADLCNVLRDPLAATVLTGQSTGTCCFCARDLTDDRSVRVGYGPICAGRYGLPWGENGLRGPDVIDVTTVLSNTREHLVGPPIGSTHAPQLPRTARARAPVPARPPIRSYEDGGPDDEDRGFM